MVFSWDKFYEYFIRLKGLNNERVLHSANTKQLLSAQSSVSAGIPRCSEAAKRADRYMNRKLPCATAISATLRAVVSNGGWRRGRHLQKNLE